MKNSTSMKILPIQNNYLIHDYSTYYNTNNYQYFDIFLPKQSLKRQVSSSALSVKNNLLNSTQQIQSQQQYPQLQQKQQQIPVVNINLLNTKPILLPAKSEQKIIRIEKKIYKRNIHQKKPQILMPNLSMDYYGNSPKNVSMDRVGYSNNYNFNNNANIIYNDKDNLSLDNNKQISNLTSNEYEITSPIKKNKFISYISLNSSEKNYQNSPKTDIKYQNQNQNQDNYLNNFNYTEYKKYNNEYNDTNINYITDIIPIENDDKINNISDTNINTSMNNLTTNYLQTSNSNDYITNNNNYTEPININNNNTSYNNISKNLYNNFLENSSTNNNSNQIYAFNPNNYTNNNIIQIPKLTTSHSSSNIRANNNFKNNNIMKTQIKIENPHLSRSISIGNKNYNNKGTNYNNHYYNYNQNQLFKNEFIPHKNLQNITIIKDPMIPVNNIYKNDIYSYNQNQKNTNDNYSNQDLSSYNSSLSTQNNNSNINNNYNINFNININQDYNNKNILNNPNNYIQIEPPQLEPTSNFNLLEFIKVGIVGKGTEGIIYAVKWKKNNKKYALKKGYIKLIEVVKKRQEEINMLKEFRKKTNSDGVVNIYGYLCVTNKHNCYNFYEIMELAEIDWDQEIERRGQLRLYYLENELMNIMYQIVHTFSLLEQNHITHRDIKPQNIIIVNGKYKIIDFGNARILKRDGLVIQRIRGSEMYMSPVMFKAYHSKMPRVKHNTFKSDVFSLGMCFLLAASLSYTPLNTIREIYDINIISKVIMNYIGQRYSENVSNILIAMLQVEEYLRPDFIQLENLFRKVNGYI